MPSHNLNQCWLSTWWCYAKGGWTPMPRISKFYRRQQSVWSVSIKITAIKFQYDIEYDERVLLILVASFKQFNLLCKLTEKNEIKEHDSYPFAKGVHTPFAKQWSSHSHEASNEEGAPPFCITVSTTVARFQMERGCTSLFEKQFQPKSTTNLSIVRDASGNKPLPEQMLTQIYVVKWRH